MLISILIDVHCIQNDVFYFEKGLNGQMYSSSDATYVIKKCTPSKISHFPCTGDSFLPHPLTILENPDQWHKTSGYMLNA